jgi:hypothetical protein
MELLATRNFLLDDLFCQLFRILYGVITEQL